MWTDNQTSTLIFISLSFAYNWRKSLNPRQENPKCKIPPDLKLSRIIVTQSVKERFMSAVWLSLCLRSLPCTVNLLLKGAQWNRSLKDKADDDSLRWMFWPRGNALEARLGLSMTSFPLLYLNAVASLSRKKTKPAPTQSDPTGWWDYSSAQILASCLTDKSGGKYKDCWIVEQWIDLFHFLPLTWSCRWDSCLVTISKSTFHFSSPLALRWLFVYTSSHRLRFLSLAGHNGCICIFPPLLAHIQLFNSWALETRNLYLFRRDGLGTETCFHPRRRVQSGNLSHIHSSAVPW